MQIGIAISTKNRREIAEHSISQWRKYLPQDARLVIVDDCSDVPYPDADFRFEEPAGIAKVKNKCLSLLEGCDHIFLIDDDIYALHEKWWQPYVHGTPQHACYIFGREELWQEPDYIAYDLPRGCLLYFTNHCVKTCGGYDEKFNVYGFEHPALSRRIFNMGLTPAPYIDVPNSKGLFYSHDEELTTRSSLPANERYKHIKENKKYFELTQNSNKFIPYK